MQLLKRRFTTHQYHQMFASGILAEQERVELIRGEVLEMSQIGSRHAACVNRLVYLFAQSIADRAIVSPQNPIELDNFSESQPDITLLRPRSDFYASRLPQPQDVLLVIEVADTTVDSDRTLKVPLYAATGILEAWLVDLNADLLEVYRQPTPEGYQEAQVCDRGQSISPLALPDIIIAIAAVLG